MKGLQTDRLIIRPWTIEDLEDFYEYAKDDRVGPNAGWPTHQSIERSRRILESFIESEEVSAIVLRKENKVIGGIGLHAMRGKEHTYAGKIREIGYVLNPKYWGCGYATEAVRVLLEYGFEELKLDRIWCTHFEFNERSKRVIEKCHFHYIKKEERRLSLVDEIRVITYCYSMTKEAYYKSKIE